MGKGTIKQGFVSENLGLKIRSIRLKQGLTISELAQLSGVSSSYINRLENGERKNISVYILKKLSFCLSVPLQELLALEEQDLVISYPDIIALLIDNDFTIDGQLVSRDLKESMIDLLKFINEAQWDNEFRNQEIFELLELVDEYKRKIALL